MVRGKEREGWGVGQGEARWVPGAVDYARGRGYYRYCNHLLLVLLRGRRGGSRVGSSLKIITGWVDVAMKDAR